MNFKSKLLLRPILIPVFVLIAIVIFTFWPAVHFDFLNFDDNVYVTDNYFVKTGLTWNNIHWAFTHSHGGHWHPLSWMSHQLDCTLFGLNPLPPHLINILIHALNTSLLFLLLTLLFNTPILAFTLSLLFAIHPLRIESVAWVTERKDVLSLCFGLQALIAYTLYQKSKKSLTIAWAIIAFSLGLLAKPSLVMIPILFLLLDIFIFSKPITFDLVLGKQKIIFYLITLLSCLSALWAQNAGGALKKLSEIAFTDRLSASIVGFVFYLSKTILPTELAAFYPYTFYPLSKVLIAAGILGVIGLGVYWASRSDKIFLLGIIWFTLSLLPVIGLAQIGWQAYACRWAYWPHVGFTVMLCGFFKKYPKAPAFIFPLLLLCFFQTRSELTYWKNSETLFKRALEITQNNFLAHTNYAAAIAEHGLLKEALHHNEEALKINPHYTEALNNLGTVYGRLGRYHEAIATFERILQRSPGDIITRYNLALTHYFVGEKDQAIQEWQTILRDDPHYEDARQSLLKTTGKIF